MHSPDVQLAWTGSMYRVGAGQLAAMPPLVDPEPEAPLDVPLAPLVMCAPLVVPVALPVVPLAGAPLVVPVAPELAPLVVRAPLVVPVALPLAPPPALPVELELPDGDTPEPGLAVLHATALAPPAPANTATAATSLLRSMCCLRTLTLRLGAATTMVNYSMWTVATAASLRCN